MDKLRDLVVKEQFLNVLPSGVHMWVNERKPKTSAEAVALADDYLQATKQSKKPLIQVTEEPVAKTSPNATSAAT